MRHWHLEDSVEIRLSFKEFLWYCIKFDRLTVDLKARIPFSVLVSFESHQFQ